MIKDRIAHIVRAKNLTATQFAEMMQIQPSNVSHLLSGRNKPSLDFLMKLKEVFPEYNFDWIILGKKPITTNEPSLFNKDNQIEAFEVTRVVENEVEKEQTKEVEIPYMLENEEKSKVQTLNNFSAGLKQIIYVFEDHSFEIYNIRK